MDNGTVAVVIQMVQGEVDFVKVFSVTRLAKEYVENFFSEADDSDNWTREWYGDDDLIFTHKTLNEQIIIFVRPT